MSGSTLCVPRNETGATLLFPKHNYNALSPNFHIHVSVRELFIYSHDRSAYFAAAKKADQSWEKINRSQIRYMNVGIGKEAAQFYFWEYINRIFVTVSRTTFKC
jgi:hypothetical protein